ncbi:MAG: class I SAM-dependent methyltransferase [Sphingomonadales bacterium]|nr:MAG: class I SAM-dependent methyltransferase [Sphingomonadales bacterium]
MKTALNTAKEIARHLVFKMRLRRPKQHVRAGRAETFSTIYSDGTWVHGRDDVPSSGEGSSLPATTQLRASLPGLLDRLQATSVLDIGCGDFTWMQALDLPCPYVGVDIVGSVIAQNQAQFGSLRRKFIELDAVTDPLPTADIVLCREVLFHLSFADGLALLRNALATEARYLIMTTDRGTVFNSDIATGDFRPLNLERAPFRLPRPIDTIEDSAVADGRLLGIWTADSVSKVLSARG